MALQHVLVALSDSFLPYEYCIVRIQALNFSFTPHICKMGLIFALFL